MKIQIQFFGKFRDYGQEMIFECDSPVVSDIKDKLFDKLKLHEADTDALKKLIASSRLSSNDAVLNDNDTHSGEKPMCILPPVSGG
jgi:molybdopterin converting factor small subunit